MSGVRPEVVFALSYAAFLVLAAYALRHAGRRIVEYVDGEPSWAHGLAAGFRFRLAATLLVLAEFILLAAGWRFHRPVEATLLMAMGIGIGLHELRRLIAR